VPAFRRLRLIAPRFSALMAAGLLAGCAAADGGPIRIGVAGSFSDPIGLPMKLAAEMAADEINAAGGIGGRRLELVTRDDYADPDSAVFVAGDLYHSGVVAVVGHLFSGTTLAASPVYNDGEDPVAAISPSSSSPEVSSAGDHTFRICPSDLAHGATLARWARERLGLERGAVLYLNDQYGRGIRRTFVEEFLRLGGRLHSVDPYLGDTPDVGPYLDRLARDRSSEFLVVAGNRGEAEEVIRQARRRGLTMPILGGDGLEGIEGAGALAEGVFLTSSYFPTLTTEANRKFVENYRRRFPEAGMPNQPAAATYDAVHLLGDVIARAGTDRQAVRRALAAVGSETPPFEGVTGLVAFDAAGDLADQNVYVGMVRGGAVDVADRATDVARGR